jgi:dTDP-4-amino-4,6-dideoxygalactose transaminase
MINIAAPQIGNDEFEAVRKVLESGMLAQGPRVEEFEKAFAGYIGTKHAIAVNSGTAALHIALLAAGIEADDEVITTPFSFIASSNAALFCGAWPIFVDISDSTFNINPHMIEQKITPKTKAIIVVHLYGQPCDMEPISKICRKHNLILIEDACQAHGSEYKGRKVGSFGIGCFSFYPTKNMTTSEGGMITTNDDEIARRARMLRAHGQSQRYIHEDLGYNFRMTDISAAIGICQLAKLDESNGKRVRNAAYLSKEISGIKGLVPPYIAPDRTHVYHQYTIRVTDAFRCSRDELQKHLVKSGVGCAVHYPIPLHRQPLYVKLGYNGSLPMAEAAAAQVLSLPVHPGLSQDDLETIVKALKDA